VTLQDDDESDSADEMPSFLRDYEDDQDEELDPEERQLQKQIVKHLFANNRLSGSNFKYSNRMNRQSEFNVRFTVKSGERPSLLGDTFDD